MEDQDSNDVYNNVVDKLLETLGEVLSRDVMFSIVESYNGDLDRSANAILNITMDGSCETSAGTENDLNSTSTLSNINMDGNRMSPTVTENDMKPNHIFTFSTNNTDVNQPGVSQQQMGQVLPQNEFSPPMSNSPPVKQPGVSYSNVYQTPVLPKNPALRPITKSETTKPMPKSKSYRNIEFISSATNHKLKTIYKKHEHGWRTLIILRGAPGCGKTFLAQNIVDIMYNKSNSNYKMHIFSTDQYFMRGNAYEYCKFKLTEAHQWNQRCVLNALKQGVSPVIVDNTNTEIWEMRQYVEFGVNYGYIIEVLEPETPWAKKAKVLSNRCSHNVPYINIQRMLDNFQPNVTGEYLLRYFGYSYKPGMTPPVLRKLPQYSVQLPEQSGTSTKSKQNFMLNSDVEEGLTNKPNLKQQPHYSKGPLQTFNNTQNNSQTQAIKEDELGSSSPISSLPRHQVEDDKQNNIISVPLLLNASVVDKQENASSELSIKNSLIEEQTLEASIQNETEQNLTFQRHLEFNQLNEVQNTLEAFEKVETEWESGEKWEEKTKEEESDPQGATSYDAKPQRKNKITKSKSIDNIFNGSKKKYEDWSTLCMYLPPWSDENKNKNLPDQQSKPIVEKKSSHTCMEIGDTTISYAKNPHKIITAVSRDINEFHLPITDNKIPDQWMLDKSTSTHDNQILVPTTRCKNEEQHFKLFVQLFKNTDKSVLRDIFDKCCGDVNWAVDIVLDGMGGENLNITDSINTPIQDIDVPVIDCDCLSAYNLIPDRMVAASSDKQTSIQKETQSPINLKKVKKEIVTSEASIELKRQIEENIVIPDSHYSEHCLKVRKHRRGEVDVPENIDTEKINNMEPESSVSSQTPKVEDQNTQLEYYLPSTSKMRNGVAETCYTDSCENPDGDIETVNVTIGKDLILKLNEVYGGRTVELLDIIKPTINIPMFLLNEINALWVESVSHQIEENSKQSELMLEQDEELARQLAFKEEELSLAGRTPEIPDFKEIMDMDFALSLYQKDVAEWRNNLPDDLAAKLSREKLYNLFPSISSDVLSELLLAHDNNFQSTVEVLLTSTGQSEILSAENGVNKFVMEKEMERQEKLLQEEKEALSEVEWPLLQKSDKVDMSVVQKYRDEADKHLKFRNLNYQKAQDYIRRGMTQVGSYFSDVAAFHKMKFEQANSWAAASLMQVHAANATDLFTLDLHFLRVGEAKEAVDLFLDSHIQKLRELKISSNQYHSLFFITGRGLHSQGKPKLKPAVKKRLLERGLFCGERNPGLIATRICAANALSHQIA